ncbi:hypothetical protein VTJ04DRAFT_9677 [Mycothermus thermophilus]|uniref:uncharacterized protein n=1 Tax=Humicola insolens TaxID=85995 RepID=UPI0037449D4E
MLASRGWFRQWEPAESRPHFGAGWTLKNAPLYGPDWPGCPTYPDNDRQATPGFSAVVETIHAPSVHWLAVIQQLPRMILYTYPLTLARGFKAIRLDGSIIAAASEFPP